MNLDNRVQKRDSGRFWRIRVWSMRGDIHSSTAANAGTCANIRSLRRDRIEEVVLGAVRDNLMQPSCVEAFAQAYLEETNRQRREASAGRDALERDLAAVTRKLDQLIDAISEGGRGAGLQTRMDELETRKAALEAQLTAPQPSPVRLHRKRPVRTALRR